MPGFNVGTIGDQDGPSSKQDYVYTYTWRIFEMFESKEDLIINAKDATLPTFSVGIETKQGASLEYKYAKNVSYDDVKVSFYDTFKRGEDGPGASSLLALMKQWRESVWTEELGIKTAEQYKRNTGIDVFDPAGNKRTDWQLVGSWPSTIRHGELTYTSSDVKIVEVTVTYDYAREETPT